MISRTLVVGLTPYAKHERPEIALFRLYAYEPSPARSLNTSSGSVELLLQVIERSERFFNCGLERTILEDTTSALVNGR